MLPDAQLASEAGTFRPDKQGKAFAARMSDELEPLHRVRWSWQPHGPPASSVDGKRACGSKLLSQQVQHCLMHTLVCEASACYEVAYDVALSMCVRERSSHGVPVMQHSACCHEAQRLSFVHERRL